MSKQYPWLEEFVRKAQLRCVEELIEKNRKLWLTQISNSK